jgi:cytochrome c oxidase subunit 2
MGRALAILIWLLTTASVLLFFGGWWFPKNISTHGGEIDQQFILTLIVVAIAFVAAEVGLGYALWRYGAAGEDRPAVYSHGNNRLEVTWTLVTAVVFITLAILGQRVWAKRYFQPAPANSFQIHVVPQQFQWNFHYPGPDGVFGRTNPRFMSDAGGNFVGLDDADPRAKDDVQVTTLAVPVNRPVELIMHGKDVTHAIWIPQLRLKQDVVPGMNLRVYFTATETGKYEIACAELCGQFHYRMKAYLLVLPDDEFNSLTSLKEDDFKTRITELLARYK